MPHPPNPDGGRGKKLPLSQLRLPTERMEEEKLNFEILLPIYTAQTAKNNDYRNRPLNSEQIEESLSNKIILAPPTPFSL